MVQRAFGGSGGLPSRSEGVVGPMDCSTNDLLVPNCVNIKRQKLSFALTRTVLPSLATA